MDIRFEFGNKQIGSGDMDLFGQMTGQLRNNVQEFQQAAWLIRDGIGLAQSIDDFLDIHRNNANLNLYGKAAIVKAVLEAERKSRLYFGGTSGIETFDPNRFADTWFIKFMHMLSRGIPRENVRELFERVSFINFNYDRCIEHFLVNALQKLHGIREDEAADILSDLQIIHPYGVVGNVPFGSPRANYLELAAGIKTYTEQLGEEDVIHGMANEIRRAECIIFLGFAYHRQNLQILSPAVPMSTKPVFGTAFGMSDADVEVTAHQLDAWFEHRDARAVRSIIKLENKLKSADLFDNYARSLSGGD